MMFGNLNSILMVPLRISNLLLSFFGDSDDLQKATATATWVQDCDTYLVARLHRIKHQDVY